MHAFKKDKVTERIVAILRARKSPLSEEVSKFANIKHLAHPLREAVVDELGDEFSQKGLCEDSEPNDYGVELEMLTDACALAWD